MSDVTVARWSAYLAHLESLVAGARESRNGAAHSVLILQSVWLQAITFTRGGEIYENAL